MGPHFTGTDPLPQCCVEHQCWARLVTRLVGESSAPVKDVIRAVASARRAVTTVGLDHAAGLQLAELIARKQLTILDAPTRLFSAGD